MIERQGTPGDDVRPGASPHEEFLELCALSASGTLTENEKEELERHLAACPDCRQAKKEFEAVVGGTIPGLASECGNCQEVPCFSVDAAEKRFLERLSEEEQDGRRRLGQADPWPSPLVIRQSRSFRQRFERYYLWLPLAAAILFSAALGLLAYRSGISRGVELGRFQPPTPVVSPATFENALEGASRDRDAARAQLAERNKAIAELQREIAREREENRQKLAIQAEQQAALGHKNDEQNELLDERNRAVQQATADQAALQTKLETLERQRSQDIIRTASLEGQVAELSRSLQEEQGSKDEEEELLAKDRDIRELIGARDLYVAEVHDVESSGSTKKAFGRVFYTKGKSLIFYAYDLNEQPGLKDASTFEVWGRRGPDWSQAYKLGMFYEDNASKKRWVLKFNDKKTLDQIDAVFVTVEPHGGSDRPTGKPLLFAYLSVAANHP